MLSFSNPIMPKQKRSINDNIKREFPFIKSVDENVQCTLCNSKFCISQGSGFLNFYIVPFF
jgi:hypothetical protein